MARSKIDEGDFQPEWIEQELQKALRRDGARLLGGLIGQAAGKQTLKPAPGQRCFRRPLTIVSVFGKTTFLRQWIYDPAKGGGHAPFDQKLGLVRGHTWSAAKLMCRAAARGGYLNAASDLLAFAGIEICYRQIHRVVNDLGPGARAFFREPPREAPQGAPVPVFYIEMDGVSVPVLKKEVRGRPGKQPDGSARTREAKIGCVFTQHHTDPRTGKAWRDVDSTSYVAGIEPAAEFGSLLKTEARRRGLGLARTVVVIGDGAEWIWKQASDKFPCAVQIVDYYHACEHLADLARLIAPDDCQQLLKRWKKQLLNSQVGKILSHARSKKADAVDPAQVEQQLGYFENNRKRMRYKSFRQKGYFIGSGVVEAGCRTVVGQRLKQSGMFWSVAGANNLVAFRCALLSRRFEDLCDQLKDAA